eukprot:scaffold21083_cov65-Phaeocystis_antarctica.AAC.2
MCTGSWLVRHSFGPPPLPAAAANPRSVLRSVPRVALGRTIHPDRQTRKLKRSDCRCCGQLWSRLGERIENPTFSIIRTSSF